MDDLVEWLRAQLDEDERIAREAPPGPWYIGGAVDPTKPCQVNTFPDLRLVADGLNWLVAEHIAVHNPARVLREIDAKRQVLAGYDKTVQGVEDLSAIRDRLHARSQDVLMTELDLESTIHRRDALHGVVRLLALPYADRPGYRDDWRP